jgi:hypothetical protein
VSALCGGMWGDTELMDQTHIPEQPRRLERRQGPQGAARKVRNSEVQEAEARGDGYWRSALR